MQSGPQTRPEPYSISFRSPIRLTAQSRERDLETSDEQTPRCQQSPPESPASDWYYRNDTVQEQGMYRDLPSEALHLILRRKLDSNTKFLEQRRQ